MLKGFIVRTRIVKGMITDRLRKNEEYFTIMRDRIVGDAQVTIAYNWRKYQS